MRTRPSLGLLLLATLLIQVSLAELDLYLEGEEVASNEFLEVKEESGIVEHLKRIKRDWWSQFSIFPSTTVAPESEAVTEDLDYSVVDNKDDEDHSEGSGSLPESNLIDADTAGEKTLRVTFVVVQPYRVEYSNRDSPQFQQFSNTLAQAVNERFDNLPGTQRASLIRIQSRLSDNFSCKVTLDIVTTGFEDTDRIRDTLRDHIRDYSYLGGLAVKDEDFSANVVNPGSAIETCQIEEIQCDDGSCVSGNSRCNGFRDCHDGSDEQGCPVEEKLNTYQQSNKLDVNPNAQANCENPIPCASSSVTICPDQKCNGYPDCPSGDDEAPELCNSEQEPDRGDQSLFTPTVHSSYDDTATTPATSVVQSCPAGEFQCDVIRCISKSQVCDHKSDCTDGSDELNCPKKLMSPMT